jgi:hypothetical protein
VEPPAAHPFVGLTYPQGVLHSPDRGLIRLARGATIGAVATGLGMTLHSWSHHRHPSVGLIALLLPIAAALGTALANRRFGFSRAFAVLLLIQPVIHVVALATEHSEHAMAPVPPSVAVAGPPGQMLVAHVVAAALAAWWIACGDRVVWRWINDVSHRLTPTTRICLAEDHALQPVAETRTIGLRRSDVLTSAPLRAPPIDAAQPALAH